MNFDNNWITKKLNTLTPPKPDGKEILGRVKDIVTQETRDIKDLVELKILFGVGQGSKGPKFTNMDVSARSTKVTREEL